MGVQSPSTLPTVRIIQLLPDLEHNQTVYVLSLRN